MALALLRDSFGSRPGNGPPGSWPHHQCSPRMLIIRGGDTRWIYPPPRPSGRLSTLMTGHATSTWPVGLPAKPRRSNVVVGRHLVSHPSPVVSGMPRPASRICLLVRHPLFVSIRVPWMEIHLKANNIIFLGTRKQSQTSSDVSHFELSLGDALPTNDMRLHHSGTPSAFLGSPPHHPRAFQCSNLMHLIKKDCASALPIFPHVCDATYELSNDFLQLPWTSVARRKQWKNYCCPSQPNPPCQV